MPIQGRLCALVPLQRSEVQLREWGSMGRDELLESVRSQSRMRSRLFGRGRWLRLVGCLCVVRAAGDRCLWHQESMEG
jgi:hypothetical protein